MFTIHYWYRSKRCIVVKLNPFRTVMIKSIRHHTIVPKPARMYSQTENTRNTFCATRTPLACSLASRNRIRTLQPSFRILTSAYGLLSSIFSSVAPASANCATTLDLPVFPQSYVWTAQIKRRAGGTEIFHQTTRHIPHQQHGTFQCRTGDSEQKKAFFGAAEFRFHRSHRRTWRSERSAATISHGFLISPLNWNTSFHWLNLRYPISFHVPCIGKHPTEQRGSIQCLRLLNCSAPFLLEHSWTTTDSQTVKVNFTRFRQNIYVDKNLPKIWPCIFCFVFPN